MLKIFMTGDNHFGKKYSRYPEIRERLIQSRYDSLNRCVRKAEEEGCELFAVTGDLFDSTTTVDKATVKTVAEILAAFDGTVVVLPGNHDYYTGEEKIWKWFEDVLSKVDNNVILLKEFRPYVISCGSDKVTVYPAFCQSKHSEENNLKWIRQADIERSGTINIGIAHGAIAGITPDMNQQYFLMTEKELASIPMDAWLIGHTHIPYPADLSETADSFGYRIFNAGTHEQTDLSNNTEGLGFILTIEKEGEESKVGARKYVSGRIRYYDLKAEVNSHRGDTLEDVLDSLLKEQVQTEHGNAVLRVTASGTVSQGEYEVRKQIAKEKLDDFLSYEFVDGDLREEISADKIHSDFAETSFAARFLDRLSEDPAELQMAYQLLLDCRERE